MPGVTGRARRSAALVLGVLYLAVSGAIWLLVPGLRLAPSVYPALVWTAVFAGVYLISERYQFHAEVRQQSFSMSFSDLVQVLSVFLLGPALALLARFIGSVTAFAVARAPLRKVFFNLCLFILETTIFAALVSGVLTTSITEPHTWGIVLLALVVASAVTYSQVFVIIAVQQERLAPAEMLRMSLPAFLVSVVGGSMALVVLIMLAQLPLGVVLLVVVIVFMVAALVQYGGAVQERRALTQIDGFARGLHSPAPERAAEQHAVEAVREIFNAERAAVWFAPGARAGDRTGFAWAQPAAGVTRRPGRDDDPNRSYPGPEDPQDPLRQRVAGQADAVLFRSDSPDPDVQLALRRRGVNEVIAVSLRSAGRTVGYLEVCDRSGDKLDLDRRQVPLMQAAATHVAAAAQNAQLLRTLRFDARHDPVSGLPNRLAVTELTAGRLPAPTDEGTQVAAILLDLGTLAQVNDTLGHDAGDELLRSVGDRLVEASPAGAVVARMGGDEFAVVLEVPSLEHAEAVAAELRIAMVRPLQVSGVSLEVNPTLGVALAPLHATDAATLLQRADIARYAGRARSRELSTYEPEMEQGSLRRLHLGTQLREAMLSGQIFCVYQPLYHLPSAQIRSVETLVRWNHPRYGMVPPDDFIAVAERVGMITPLTLHVLDLALDKCAEWTAHQVPLRVAVNLSARTLLDTEFPGAVAQLLADKRVDPSMLTFEITESSIMTEPETSLAVMGDLHRLGIKLSLDDFGTGYSSLSYLSRLPVDEVKIDKTFVSHLGTEISASAITRSIIELAHGLGLTVVAEGVEDELTRDLLSGMGCDTIQGYLVSRPLPGPRLDRWMAVRTAAQPSGSDHPRLLQPRT